MSLTNDDLQAIKIIVKEIVDGAIDTKVPAIVDHAIDTTVPAIVQAIVDKAVEASDLRTEAGLEEIRIKLDVTHRELKADILAIDNHIGQVERIVSAEVSRGDQHSLSIQKIRKSLRAA